MNHRERQDRIYLNGGGGATSNARSVPGEASASLDATEKGAGREVQFDNEEVG